MANVNQNPLVSFINPLDPNSAVDAVQIQRQQAIADMLRQQAMEPLKTDTVAGGWNVPVTRTQTWGKLAQALLGGLAMKGADRNAGEFQKNSMASLIKALDPKGQTQAVSTPVAAPAALAMGGASGNTPPVEPTLGAPTPQPGEIGSPVNRAGPTPQTAAIMDNMTTPAPESTGSSLNPLNMNKELAAYMLRQSPDKYFEAQAAAYKPTEASLLARAAGMDPKQANAGTLFKNNYIAPINAREGSTIIDPKTMRPVFNAPNKEGIQYQFGPDGSPTAQAVPGFTNALSAFEAARLAGKNQQTLAAPEYSPTLPNGQIIPTTVAATINPRQGTPGSQVPGIAPTGGVGAPFGQKSGADNAQTEMSKKFSELTAANQTTQTTNSYLQNIKSLASKAAVGPQSDKIQFVNGLLSLVGNEKATDAVTANNLMSKYSGQIIARLGQGALGTDAARSIVESANPNSKMNLPAIQEAVDNLVGANEMIKAKMAILAPHGNARDPKAYSEKEIKFDQNADPRIFQYAAMDPAQKAAFKSKLVQSGEAGSFSKKIRELEQLGVKF